MELQNIVYKSKKLPQKQIDAITQRIYNKSLSYIDRKKKLVEGIKEIDDPQCTFQPNYAKKLKQRADKERERILPSQRREKNGTVLTKHQLRTENQLRRQLVNIKVMKPYQNHLRLASQAAFIRQQDFIRRFPQHYPEKEQRLAIEMEMFNQSVKYRYW